MFDDIKHSYPPIDDAAMSAGQRALFASLPDEYQAFLRSHNGGFARELRYTFLTKVPYKTDKIDNPSRDDWVVEFFGIRTAASEGRWPACLVQLAGEHRAGELLPADVIAIAGCSQSSLVCISLRPENRGTIYYRDYYWDYPWCRSFFEERIERARSRFKEPQTIMENAGHPDHEALTDALRLATLVKLSDTFSDWCQSCFDGTRGEAHE